MRSIRFSSASLLFLLAAAALLQACADRTRPESQGQTTKPAVLPPVANDFPTLARVEYVMQCMQEHGGQNYDNLYHCTCAVDIVAGMISYDEFSQAQTYTYLFGMAGDRGGEFRDPPQSEQLRRRLKEAKAQAQAVCFPKSSKNSQPKN